jgi:hypothetical protein
VILLRRIVISRSKTGHRGETRARPAPSEAVSLGTRRGAHMPVGFRAPTAADECIEQLTPVCDWASINALILYAQRRGAFIDLAADLSWLTGRDPSEFVLDHHFTLPNHLDAPEGLTVASVINQAIGVLIAHGRTPEQATVS